MAKRSFKNILGAVCIMILSCSNEMPVEKDGGFIYEGFIIDSSGVLLSKSHTGSVTLDGTSVMLQSISYFQDFENQQVRSSTTDNIGLVRFENLQAGKYILSAFKDTFYTDKSTGRQVNIKLTGFKQLEISPHPLKRDTVYTSLHTKASIVINELYYCGPPNKSAYIYDQFVELYNTTDKTVYLDGLLLGRARSTIAPDLEKKDYVQIEYLYQFPGTQGETKDYPLDSGAFTVIAGDATDHSQYIKTALNLSEADWEFYDSFGGEPDYPAPNVNNVLVSEPGDFLMSKKHDTIVLAYDFNPDNHDIRWYYGEDKGWDNEQFIHIPEVNLIDLVNYAPSLESPKEVKINLDAGFAGIGMAPYSGKSVERRVRGFDTNNSTFDFEIIDTPTPGYQH